MPIDDDFKHQVKMANPLDSVISKYVTLKRSGRNFVACCPFHSEKTPSFHVNTTEGYYKCFGCGESGDVFSFIMKVENLTFIEALRLLAERAGMSMPKLDRYSYNDKDSQKKNVMYAINREANVFFYQQLKSSPQTKDYIKNKRGFSGEVALKTYRMGYAPDDWWSLISYLRDKGYSDDDIINSGLARMNDHNVIYSFFKNRVMVPILDNRGNVIAFGGRLLDDGTPKYLNSPDTLVFKKSENLFSLNLAKSNLPSDKTILLAEGYMDVIALYQAGFKNAVATLGTALTVEQVNVIKRYADRVIICYDNDIAGINATNRAVSLFLSSPNTKDIDIKVLRIQGAKDPDEYIKVYGREKFKVMLNDAVDGIDFQLSQVRDSLNLNTNYGKTEMLKQSAQVLSQVQSEICREVYATSVAREFNIRPDILSGAINGIIRENHSKGYHRPSYKKTDGINYVNGYEPLEHIICGTKEEVHNYTTRKYAEEDIIASISMFYDIDLIYKVLKNSIMDIFVFESYKNILKVICDHAEKVCEFCDISVVHDDLSEGDYNVLISIIDSHKEDITYDIAERIIDDCIDTIKKSIEDSKVNDLSELWTMLRRRHNVET